MTLPVILFICLLTFLYGFALVDKISTDMACSRGLSAVAELLVLRGIPIKDDIVAEN